MTHICVMSSHKPIRIYMEGLILGVNTLYRLFSFFKLFPMVSKGLTLYQPYIFKEAEKPVQVLIIAGVWNTMTANAVMVGNVTSYCSRPITVARSLMSLHHKTSLTMDGTTSEHPHSI